LKQLKNMTCYHEVHHIGEVCGAIGPKYVSISQTEIGDYGSYIDIIRVAFCTIVVYCSKAL
jgi:hypothetical protein